MPRLLDIAYHVAAAGLWVVRPGKVRRALADRDGRVAARRGGGPCVLIHAVSVGEVNATRALVSTLRQQRPGVAVVVSTSTDTGTARAAELFADVEGVATVRFPLDFSSNVRRFLDAVRPDMVMLMELELWPNFIAECDRRGVPVLLGNGRITAKSFNGYRRLGPLIRPTFRRLAGVLAQDETYAARFGQLGCERVEVAGSMKFDTASSEQPPGVAALAAELGFEVERTKSPQGPRTSSMSGERRGSCDPAGRSGNIEDQATSSDLAARPLRPVGPQLPSVSEDDRPAVRGVAAFSPDCSLERAPEPDGDQVWSQLPPDATGNVIRPLVVCGSTGPGEEAAILDALGDRPIRLVFVPRKPERFDEVAALIRVRTGDVTRLTAVRQGEVPSYGVLLGDTMGELRKWYALADAVIVGRTLLDLGPSQHGSDMMEPAALGKPVAVGPFTSNFAAAMQALRRADGVLEVPNAAALRVAFPDLLGDEGVAMGQRAAAAVATHRGATARHVAIILSMLDGHVAAT